MVFAGNDLTALQAKRFLVFTANKVYPFEGFSIEVVMSAQPADTETITIGSKTYRWMATVAQADDVQSTASAATNASNLIAAITAGSGEGTNYGTGTTAHPDAHASASVITAGAHITSASSLTLTDGTSGDLDFQDYLGNSQTAMVQYESGDWTQDATLSAAITREGCCVTGFTPYAAATTSPGDLYLYNHAGLPQGSVAVNGAAAAFNQTHPVVIMTGTGIAAEIANGSSGTTGYVHYTYGRDTSNI